MQWPRNPQTVKEKVLKGYRICPTIQLKHTRDMFDTVFPWGAVTCFIFFLHRLVIRGTIDKKTRLTLWESHYCADKAGLTVICSAFCYLNFWPAFTRHMEGNCTLFSAPNECAVYWMLHRYTIKENDHQWCTLHLPPHFPSLYSLCLPRPLTCSLSVALTLLFLSPSPPLPLMSSIPYCSCIRATLICVVGWNGMFNGFFSFPGWEGRVMC